MTKTMILFLASAVAFGAASAAQARTDVRALSCHDARQLVRQSGAVVLTTGPDTYDRYVSGFNYCAHPLVPYPAYVATADAQQCPVGFQCRQKTEEPGN